MCLHPLRIVNKGYRPLTFSARKVVEVGCGHCWQCQAKRSNDYAFRFQCEVLNPNVIPFYVTLTYSPAYLPYLTYRNSDGTLSSLSVWNRQHVQRYHKVLRRQLSYYYGLPSNAFKFFCTCERGGNSPYLDHIGRYRIATSRPHYHLLYILYSGNTVYHAIRPLPLAFYEFCRSRLLTPCLSSFFNYLLSTKWYYGIVDDVTICRSVVSCTKYIAKYITKDITEKVNFIDPAQVVHFSDLDLIKRVNSRIKHRSFLDVLNSRIHISPVKFSHLRPRVTCSKGIGFSFLDNLSVDELIMYLSGRKKVNLASRSGGFPMELPQYYFNKICKVVERLPIGSVIERFNGSSFDRVVCTPQSSNKGDWNCFCGFFGRVVEKTYTQSSLTAFGRTVMRYRLVTSYHNLLSLAKSLYRGLIPRDSSLLDKYPEDLSNFRDFKNSFSVFCSFSLSDYIMWYHGLTKNLFLDETSQDLRCCMVPVAHHKHITNVLNYDKRKRKAAFDNPDLFLPHF